MKRMVVAKDECAAAEPEAKRTKTEEANDAETVLELDEHQFECVVCFGKWSDHSRLPVPTPVAAGKVSWLSCPCCSCSPGICRNDAQRKAEVNTHDVMCIQHVCMMQEAW